MGLFNFNTFGVPQLSTPRQAAALFNPDSPHPIRQKHLFVVSFLRDPSADSQWRENLTFVVKSIDRPQIQPTVEKLNQYNKKRLIHTGVEYSPINVSFYDTADGAAMNMWIQYARYYFGDYQQNLAGYSDDILSDVLTDNTIDRRGWGFNINERAPNEGIGSQHFFHGIVVYQVWGNEYTSYELVNPRINSFNPDDLAYDSSEVSMIQMAISYEAIIHANTGRSQDIFSENTLTAMFDGGEFDGQTIEVSGQRKLNSFVSVDDLPLPSSFTELGAGLPIPAGERNEISRTTDSSVGGVLNHFGNFDFGSKLSSKSDIDNVLQSGGSKRLAGIIKGNFSGGISKTTSSLNKATDAARAAVGSKALKNIDGLSKAITGSAHSVGKGAGQTNKDHGVSLSKEALDKLNKGKDGTTQFGKNQKDGPFSARDVLKPKR